MSESSTWITRDDSGHAMRKILEAATASRKTYILQLRDELRAYVRLSIFARNESLANSFGL